MGKETGSSSAAPIFRDFMAEALKSKAKVPFRIPEGVTLSPVNRDTGEPSYIGAPNFILEAFRPGTEPRIGQLKSNIRVGSGSDSYGSYNYDFDDDAETAGTLEDILESAEAAVSDESKSKKEDDESATEEETLKEPKRNSEEEAPSVEAGDEPSTRAVEEAIEDVASNEAETPKVAPDEAGSETIEVVPNEPAIDTPAPNDIPANPPAPEEEEEDLDDGLY